ncbi:RNA-directed DNA polymerase, eukaryota [Tanacetum coccineum]
MENANPPPTRHVLPATLRAQFNQELQVLQKISAFVDSRLESIDQFLNRFTDQPNMISINDPEFDDGSDSILPGGNVSFVYRNIEGLNRSIIGYIVTSSMLNPQAMVLLINGGHLVRSQNKVSSCNKLQSVDQQYQCASVHQVYRKAQQMQGQQDEVFGQQKIQQLRMKTYTGKVFMVRAKELFTWNPSFEPHKEKVYSSDDESVQEKELNENRFNLNKEEEGELNGNEDDEVAETIFMDNSSPSMNHSVRMDKQYSADPFGLYDLLDKKTPEVETLDPSPSLSHPPGFSPVGLSTVQVDDLERGVSHDEIRSAVWDCGDNKSPGPDGFTFEFFKKYWRFIGPDFCEAVEHFFKYGLFSKGCNSSFTALIPKVMDAKFVNDYRPISLIGSVYKFVTKILANRLATCRWANFLIDVLEAFGFGSTWCNWIRGIFCYAKASILVNGSPSDEFHLHCGLKQGDPLAPYLFILVINPCILSLVKPVEEDALFMGEWSDSNLRGIIYILNCFFLASGLKINIQKSQVLGVGVPRSSVESMASSLVEGENSPIGGRLTLLKSVLGVSPLYNMSIFKVPKGVLKVMESIRSNFFEGASLSEKKISWIAWDKVLASKKKELNGNEDDEVAETIFMDNSSPSMNHSVRMDKQYSADPFGLYDLLDKKTPEVETLDPSPSLSHPRASHQWGPRNREIRNRLWKRIPSNKTRSFQVMNNSQVVQDDVSYNSGGGSGKQKGGSVLGVLEEMIRVGRAMGYSMEGCEKDIESIIKTKGDDVVFR